MHHDVVTLAALTDGAALARWVMLVVGNLFAVFLAIRAFRHFLKDDWGGMITMVIAAVFVGGFVWFTTQTKDLLGAVWSKVIEA